MGIKNISLNDVPKEGLHLVVDDQHIWNASIAEFHVGCRIVEPLRAELTILPVQGGCLVRGTLTGSVVQPCDLCAEDAPARLAHTIDTFESIPGESIPLLVEDDSEDEDFEDAYDAADSHIYLEGNTPMLHVAELCWEEFMLALPLRPLCTNTCKGLCARCGINLNEGSCSCTHEQGDPRLAALRSFKVKNSK